MSYSTRDKSIYFDDKPLQSIHQLSVLAVAPSVVLYRPI